MDYYGTFLRYYKMSNYTKDLWSWSKALYAKWSNSP